LEATNFQSKHLGPLETHTHKTRKSFFIVPQINDTNFFTQILTSARAIKRRLRRTRCDRTMEAIGASLAWTCLAHTLRDKIDE
jgi:hypothetical protein